MSLREWMLNEGAKAAESLNLGMSRNEHFSERYQRLEEQSRESGEFAEIKTLKQICNLGYLWMKCGYPQIVMNHKLAASLMATSVPKDCGWETRMPWPCFAIKVPERLVGDGEGFIVVYQEPYYAEPKELPDDAVFSFWESCVRSRHRITRSEAFPSLSDYSELEGRDITYDESDPRYSDEILNLINRETGGGRSPTVQRLIRGHRKMQAHGPEQSLRKLLWIEPYWRGPEDAPIAVGDHRL